MIDYVWNEQQINEKTILNIFYEVMILATMNKIVGYVGLRILMCTFVTFLAQDETKLYPATDQQYIILN